VTDLLDGRDDVGIGTAAADVAIHGLPYVCVAGADVLLEDSNSGHDLARGAVAALVAIMLNEGGLHGVEMARLTNAFDGSDLVIGMHDSEGQAGVDATSVDMDGAGAALAVVAALLGAGQDEVLAEAIEEGSARVEAEFVGLPVDSKSKGYSSLRGEVRLLSRDRHGHYWGRRGCDYRWRGSGKTGSSKV
jgi:hypothetical protein